MGRLQPQEAPYTPSTLPSNAAVVQLGAPQGSNHFVCSQTNAVELLVEMPSKVRRVSFAARGMFAFVELFDTEQGSSRVAGEITHVITGPEIKTWRKSGEWPKEFDIATAATDTPRQTTPEEGGVDSEESEGDEPLPENPNRRHRVVEESSDEENTSEDEDEA